jgi:hypothetical protein
VAALRLPGHDLEGVALMSTLRAAWLPALSVLVPLAVYVLRFGLS